MKSEVFGILLLAASPSETIQNKVVHFINSRKDYGLSAETGLMMEFTQYVRFPLIIS